METFMVDFSASPTESTFAPSPQLHAAPAVESRLQFIDSAASFASDDVKQQQISQVRAHVMRESRRKQSQRKRKQRLSQSTTCSSGITVSNPVQNDDRNRSKYYTATLILSEVNKVLGREPLGREHLVCSTEPRGGGPTALPGDWRYDQQRSMKPFSQSIEPHQARISPKPIWFVRAVTDPAMLSATLFMAAFHHASDLRGRPVSSRDDAISKISNSICSNPSGLGSSTITTVTTLAVHECLDGDIDQCNLHLQGLEEIISMRGDHWTDNLDLVTLQLLFWLDICDPLEFKGRFRFNWPIHSIADSLTSSILMSTSIEVPGSRKLHPDTHPAALARDYIGADFQDIFADMINLTTFINSLGPDDTAKLDRAMLGDRVFLIDLQLSASMKEFASSDISMHHMREVCRLSCLLYLNVVLRDFPPSIQVICRLVSCLRNAMELVLPQTRLLENEPLSHLLVWAFFIGAMCADGGSLYDWYISHLARLCLKLSVRQWSTVRGILAAVAWPGDECNIRFKLLWSDILEVIL